jgi:ABC-type uncharacterized transport system ATPase subunit
LGENILVNGGAGFIGSHLVERLRALARRDGHSSEETIWALKAVSFEVRRGEVLGVPSVSLRAGIGRNGAGKSTVLCRHNPWLKILSRITEPTEGAPQAAGPRRRPEPAEGSTGGWAVCWRAITSLKGEDCPDLPLDRGQVLEAGLD